MESSHKHAAMLAAYNRWANERVLAIALELPEDVFERRSGASFESVGGNLRHMLMAQDTWLQRWTGEPAPRTDLQSRERLRAAFAASHDAIDAFAASLGDGDWDRIVHYDDSQGQPHEVPLGVLFSHVVNHGTHHRAEVGMVLASLERSPGDLDLVYYALGSS